MTSWLILAGICIAAILPLFFRKLRRNGGRHLRPGYQKKDCLFVPEERTFFLALQRALGHQFSVLPKLRLGDIVSARAGGVEDLEDHVLPFVLCRNLDLSIACVVELREHGHPKRKDAEPDPAKPILEAAGIPVIGFETGPLYDANEIVEVIAAALRTEDPLFATEADGRREPRISGLDRLEL